MIKRTSLPALAAVLSLSLLGCVQDTSELPTWVPTWAASPSTPGQFGQPGAAGPDLENRTLRQIVHTSVGGDSVRVRISNRHGSQPLEIGAAYVASSSAGAQITAALSQVLTFGTETSITIPVGAYVISDPVAFAVQPLADLAISLYFPAETGTATAHRTAVQTNYVSPPGNFAASEQIPDAETTPSWFFLTAVEVKPRERTGVVVTLGNSITDGTGSTADANSRWPDHLARRLAERDAGTLAVANAGIAGNRVLSDLNGFGINAQARLELDVLSLPGITHVVLLEGINDIGMFGTLATEEASPDDIIAGYLQIIARLRARGLKVYGATLTPFEGAFYYSDVKEEQRQQVNEWIRTSGTFDGVIDFDAATRDPSQPTRLLPGTTEDNLHPNDTGYRAMAAAIDLSLFDLN
jgi:lysophospholipase L1-like esterase